MNMIKFIEMTILKWAKNLFLDTMNGKHYMREKRNQKMDNIEKISCIYQRS